MERKNNSDVRIRDREVIITRLFDAPLPLVYKAFTEPQQVSKWWGPDGFSCDCSSDLRPGGSYRYVMRGPDGTEYPMTGTFTEISKEERIVYTTDLHEHPQSWKDELAKHTGKPLTDTALESVVTVTFEERNGKTVVSIATRFSSDSIRDGYVKLGMGEGWGQSLDRLAGELKNA